MDEAFGRLSMRPPYDSELRAQRPWIDDCYASDRVEDILQRLRRSEAEGTRAAADRIDELSPTALKATLRALRQARSDTSIEACLRREFRVGTRTLGGHDALEGMRAQTIGRGQAPRWEPDRLDEVREADVDAYFAPLGPGELDLREAPRG